ncbi:hypothetical protein [Yoonia sp. MH D7]
MQHFLWVNREILEPYFDLRMLRHLKPVVKLAAIYSRNKNPLALVDMAGLLDDVFNEFPVRSDRDLLISCEGLAGHLPGWPNVTDYGAVPTLMTYLAGYLAERFADAEVKILFTTRNSHDWLYSAYRHHLKGQRLTMTFAQFQQTFGDTSDLAAIINDVTQALAPLSVSVMPMSDALQHPLGPGAALVDQMNVPQSVRDTLTPVGKGNEGPDDALWAQFLTLNQSNLPDQTVQDQKKALAEAAALGGWKPL